MKVLINNNTVDKNKAKQLSEELQVNIKTIEFLLGRNISDEIIKSLVSTDFKLPKCDNITNVEEAAYLLAEYLQDDNGIIYIFADYDADGVNAGFIMNDCLTKLKDALQSNCEVSLYFPNRNEGYGLGMDWCSKIINLHKHDNKNILVITVDNGITKYREVEYLLDNNINVIITDHHMPKDGETPQNVIIVNPHNFRDTDTDSLGLCGAGVSYKICEYLLTEIYQDKESNYNLLWIPHVAIATITDVMPLTKENIEYIKYGLYLIEHDYCIEGIKYYKNYNDKNYLTAKDIAFGLGPELNACGRMLNTELAGQFFMAEDEETVENVYALVNKTNKQRKAFQKEILEQISKNINVTPESKFIIAHVDEVGGVGGVIAAKLSEQYGLPSMVLSGKNDLLHGSARGIGNINLHELFIEQVKKGYMLNFGGHQGAAGVEVNKSKLKQLTESLNDMLKDFDFEQVLEGEICVDSIITLSDINKETAEMYKDIPLYGELNEPLYMINDLKVTKTKCSANNPNNICFTVTDGKTSKDIWAWGLANKYKKLGEPTSITLIGNVEPNFMNKRFYTLNVREIITTN